VGNKTIQSKRDTMTKLNPGDWYAYQTPNKLDIPGVTKLPTDPRTIIRMYRAAMKWYRRNKADEDVSIDACWDLWETCDNAKKAKRVK
jgi:hypothetical protein